jgi:hypothetical protein
MIDPLRIEGRFCRRDEGRGQVGFWEGGEIGREFLVSRPILVVRVPSPSVEWRCAAWGHAAFKRGGVEERRVGARGLQTGWG